MVHSLCTKRVCVLGEISYSGGGYAGGIHVGCPYTGAAGYSYGSTGNCGSYIKENVRDESIGASLKRKVGENKKVVHIKCKGSWYKKKSGINKRTLYKRSDMVEELVVYNYATAKEKSNKESLGEKIKEKDDDKKILHKLAT